MTQLLWDIGTVYDFFMSLHILHHPDDYGLRKAWAKGVRARLPAAARDTLETATRMLRSPLHWLYALPEPKNGATLLRVLSQTPARERVADLTLYAGTPAAVSEILHEVAGRGSWSATDLRALRRALKAWYPEGRMKRDELVAELDMWAEVEAAGERLLEAFQAFYEAFFAEEENRIGPALAAAQGRAQSLARRLAPAELLEELSQGVRYTDALKIPELVLAPSFWITPLVLHGRLSENRHMLVYGARPDHMSLVPGEVVPDALYQGLKALADPTRLRILRYLSAEPLSPAELARRLRLRAPTVSHHLYALRLARLVQFTIEMGEKRRYTIRPGAVGSLCQSLQGFLHEAGPSAGDEAPADVGAPGSVEPTPPGESHLAP